MTNNDDIEYAPYDDLVDFYHPQKWGLLHVIGEFCIGIAFGFKADDSDVVCWFDTLEEGEAWLDTVLRLGES